LQALTVDNVLKDNDLRSMLSYFPNLVNLKFDDRMKIVKRLQSDADFLERLKLMDYSLLLAIEESHSD